MQMLRLCERYNYEPEVGLALEENLQTQRRKQTIARFQGTLCFSDFEQQSNFDESTRGKEAPPPLELQVAGCEVQVRLSKLR